MLDDAIIAINNADKIILTYHVNPDGDAIGSCLALYLYLRKLGKKALIISNDKTPNNLTFLNESENILQYAPERDDKAISDADLIIYMDFNDINRCGALKDALAKSNAKKLLH